MAAPSLSSKRVLLVEDDEINIAYFRDNLPGKIKHPVELSIAPSFDVADAWLRDQTFDLIACKARFAGGVTYSHQAGANWLTQQVEDKKTTAAILYNTDWPEGKKPSIKGVSIVALPKEDAPCVEALAKAINRTLNRLDKAEHQGRVNERKKELD